MALMRDDAHELCSEYAKKLLNLDQREEEAHNHENGERLDIRRVELAVSEKEVDGKRQSRSTVRFKLFALCTVAQVLRALCGEENMRH